MADKPKQPSWLRLLPTGGQTPWEGLPQQLRMLLRLPRPPANSLLSLGSWGCLTAAPIPLEEQEELVPITPEQWPEWEHMKKTGPGGVGASGPAHGTGPAAVFCAERDQMQIANEYSYP